MKGSNWMRASWIATAVLAAATLAQPALALPVHFLEIGTAPTGFDPNGFPMPVDVMLPLTADVRPVTSGAVVDGFGLNIGTCFILNEAPGAGCQSSQPVGSTGFTLIVDITLVSVPDAAIGQDSLIFFTALPPVPTYSLSDVSVIVDPTPVGGFTFTPFTTASYTISPSTTYYYLGFFMGLGDTATFRVDVTGDHSAAGMPITFATNGWVVPEPSTAVLLGLGLAVMSRRRSR